MLDAHGLMLQGWAGMDARMQREFESSRITTVLMIANEDYLQSTVIAFDLPSMRVFSRSSLSPWL
jgi:hypothetical protein